MSIFVGIDEAGRGPVLGPMVVAAVWVEPCNIAKLKLFKIKDSKKLTKKQREYLYDIILQNSRFHHYIKVMPRIIDSAINMPGDNLNKLEMRIIYSLLKKHNFTTAFIDSPVKNIKQYLQELNNLFPSKDIILEHKADENYIVCSAASIIAKVIRDRIIDKIRLRYGNCGSGYPSDKKSIIFLQRFGLRYPFLFRTSWKTYSTHCVQ
ncbi:MAG: ribonuclease HII [Candidatus Hydrogenedentota bacterium]